jgi:hypothetical protein
MGNEARPEEDAYLTEKNPLPQLRQLIPRRNLLSLRVRYGDLPRIPFANDRYH